MTWINIFFVCFRADFCVYLIISLLWILHSWPFGSWTCRYKHGGNEQQFEKRSRMYPNRLLVYLSLVFSADLHAFFFIYFFKESLCAQRGLLPNTEVQTFQVSLTSRLGMHYKKIQDSISRVSPDHSHVCTSAMNVLFNGTVSLQTDQYSCLSL